VSLPAPALRPLPSRSFRGVAQSPCTTCSSCSTCPEALGRRGTELRASPAQPHLPFLRPVRIVFDVWRSAMVLLAGSILWCISGGSCLLRAKTMNRFYRSGCDAIGQRYELFVLLPSIHCSDIHIRVRVSRQIHSNKQWNWQRPNV